MAVMWESGGHELNVSEDWCRLSYRSRFYTADTDLALHGFVSCYGDVVWPTHWEEPSTLNTG